MKKAFRVTGRVAGGESSGTKKAFWVTGRVACFMCMCVCLVFTSGLL